MKCPQCGINMTEGNIRASRGPIEWVSDEDRGFLGIFPAGGLRLNEIDLLSRPHVKSYCCDFCAMIIIDLNRTPNYH